MHVILLEIRKLLSLKVYSLLCIIFQVKEFKYVLCFWQ